MRKYLLIFIAFVFIQANACEINVISPTNLVKENESFYFLFGTKDGNYLVKSWQFEQSKMWLGIGEAKITVGEAIEKAKCYLNRPENIGVKEVALRSSQNKLGSVIWYYRVTFSETPLKFGANEFIAVVLLSGEIVSSNK